MKRNIEAERGRLGFTKEELSRQLGITSKTYLAYIRGASIPSKTLIAMAHLFERSVDYLLEDDNTSNAQQATA